MTTKRKLIGRLVPCRCFRGEEEVISVLDYSHCSLQQVPKEIFSFERTLEELYLDANQIEELPKVSQTTCCWNQKVQLFTHATQLPVFLFILPFFGTINITIISYHWGRYYKPIPVHMGQRQEIHLE